MDSSVNPFASPQADIQHAAPAIESRDDFFFPLSEQLRPMRRRIAFMVVVMAVLSGIGIAGLLYVLVRAFWEPYFFELAGWLLWLAIIVTLAAAAWLLYVLTGRIQSFLTQQTIASLEDALAAQANFWQFAGIAGLVGTAGILMAALFG